MINGNYKLISDNVLEIKINTSCYTREAITSTAYTLPPEYTVFLSTKDSKNWIVHISLSKDDPINDLLSTGKRFLRALIDFQLRDDLELRTGKIREIIVEQAFAPIRKREIDENE
jgi:His-Xaa-Ser system protein HxsD